MESRFKQYRARLLHESLAGESQVKDRFQVYSDYNKVLRTWIVAYGVGGPVLLGTNETLHQIFSCYRYSNFIVWLFLTGVLLQVLVAFINKWAAWQIYMGEYDDEHQETTLYKIWVWINDQPWIDFSADLISICALLGATAWAVVAISSPT